MLTLFIALTDTGIRVWAANRKNDIVFKCEFPDARNVIGFISNCSANIELFQFRGIVSSSLEPIEKYLLANNKEVWY